MTGLCHASLYCPERSLPAPTDCHCIALRAIPYIYTHSGATAAQPSHECVIPCALGRSVAVPGPTPFTLASSARCSCRHCQA
eukprot:43204-Chlamydomonas_euryale.AAC.1